MRIVDLQRRLREIGRIRIGEKVETSSGKSRPAKIDTFRLTSRDQRVIEAASDVWGGDVTMWDDAPDGPQWQVYLATKEIPVVVPPGDMSFSQAYEQWTAGGCKVRCDGRWDHQGDTACHCDPTARACDIHSRLSLILPDVPGLGMWRLDTQSYYAAVELGGVVDLCAAQSAQGVMLPARLRLEQRSVKRVANGKTQTRKFAIPVLDLDIHPLALSSGANAVTGEIGSGVAGELETPRVLTPVPPPDASLAPTVAEQMAAIETSTRAERSNAAEPIPATGLKPRTAAQAARAPVPPEGHLWVSAAKDRVLKASGGNEDVAKTAWLEAELGDREQTVTQEDLDRALEVVGAILVADKPAEPMPLKDGEESFPEERF